MYSNKLKIYAAWPLRLASRFLRTRERECIFTAFRKLRDVVLTRNLLGWLRLG